MSPVPPGPRLCGFPVTGFLSVAVCFCFWKSCGGTHCALDWEQSFIRRWPQPSHLSQRAVLELLEQVSLYILTVFVLSAHVSLICIFFMTSPFWPQTTISFSQYHNSHFCQPTLTTSSLAQATLTSHFHTVHLYITLFPHPPLPLEPFYSLWALLFSRVPILFLKGSWEMGD